MQTTELSRSSNYTSRVDKPLEKKVTIVTQRKPQYLDVALQQAINDENRSKLKNEKKVVEKVKDKSVSGSKGKSKFESYSGVSGNYANYDEKSVDRNKKAFGIKAEGKKSEEDKNKKVTGFGSPTFQEKAKFKSTQNQKLYQELDQMLSGKNETPEEVDQYPQMTSRSQKSDKVKILTKQSVYQPSSKDSKPKKPNYSTVPPLKQNGVVDPESQIFHRRELRAKQRVESIDILASGDFKGKLGSQSRISGDVTSRLNTQRGPYASQGVPVHADVVSTRHHYVADIPIYLPSFETGYQNTGPSFPGKTKPIDKAYESTIPQQTGTNTTQEPEKRVAKAPEVLAGAPPELSDLTNDSVEKPSYMNSYRQQANPVRQRLIEEQNRKFEKESMKYFDVESKMSRRSPIPSYRSSRDYADDEMHSDPGTRRRQPIDDLSRLKYSPEGFLADKERQAKKERELRRQTEFGNRNLSSNLNDDFRGYDPSFRKYSERKEGRRPLPNENSWVKAGKQTPVNTDTYRKLDHYEESKTSRDSTYRVRQDREGVSKREIDQDKDTHRTYQIPSDIRNRDRYSDRVNPDDNYTQPQKNRDYYNLLREERDSRRTKGNSVSEYQRPDERLTEERYKNSRGSDMRYASNEKLTDLKDDKEYDRNSREFRKYLEEKFKHERQATDQDERVTKQNKLEIFEEKRNDGGGTERLSTDRSSNAQDFNKGYSSHPSTRTFSEKDMNSTTGTESRYARSSYAGNYNDDLLRNEFKQSEKQDERSRQERHDQNPESANRKRKHSAERREFRTETGELKVEYVLRSKSSSTDLNNKEKEKFSQSQENMLDKDTEKDLHQKEQSSYRSLPTQRDSVLSERYENVDSTRENQNVQNPPTYETRIFKENSKHGDDFNKYFDDQENPNSPSNKIPFYSDNSSRYAKEKYEFSIPKVMTPVQETSMQQSETSDKLETGPTLQAAQTVKEKNNNSSYPDDIKDRRPVYEKGTDEARAVTSPKPSIFTTTVNKHDIPDDRKSPWRKEEPKEEVQDDKNQESNGYPVGPDFGDVMKDKKSESFEKIKAEVRQKTEEKLQEKREKTMDSQGPTVDDYKLDYPDFTDKAEKKEKPQQSDKLTENVNSFQALHNKQTNYERQSETQKQSEKTAGEANDKPVDAEEKEINIDDLNLDEVETEMDERELYVCYLMTESGEAIGPLKLDIDDVQIGLPVPPKEGGKAEDGATQRDDKTEDEGMRNRQTGSHGLNEFSSRSHSMLMLTIDSEQQDPEDENIYITKRGKLTFVDLAGSEKVKDSNSTADTLVESNSINKSLLVLGNCISSLGDHKRRQGHIPYRDSKLTKLLADSLGGNGVTLMICCITPSSNHAPETMNTLRYASRAKKIRTKPVIKMDPREKLILSLKREIKVLRNENHYLRQQLEFPAKPRGQLQKENDQKFMKMMKEANGKPAPSNPPNTVSNTHEKMKQNGASGEEGGLYEMLQEYMVENEALRTENADMQVQRDKIRQEQQMLYRDNEKLMKRVDELERRMNQAQTSWQSMPRQGSYPDQNRSRDHSPLGSPHYVRAGGSGGRGHPPPPQNRLPPPPNDLPLKDNPALRDPVYPGSPPQGYNSPTANGKGKQPPRGQPMKPPHRLNEPIGQQRPIHEQNGPPPTNGPYMNGHPVQYSPGGHPIQYRQPPSVGSPNRTAVDLRMDSRRSSQSSSSDAIKDMNERLKAELMQLEGEIHHHTVMNRNRDIYGSQGSMR